MEIAFSKEALEHLQYWKKSGNKKVAEKIVDLLKEIQISPFEGTGKPEALNISGVAIGQDVLQVNIAWFTK